MAGTWGKVKSRFVDGALRFVTSGGTTMLTLDPTSGLVEIGSTMQLSSQGPLVRKRTRVDIDATNGTLLAASIASGLIVHTSVTGAGTLTFDTAANIIAAIPALATLGNSVDFLIVNDGDQTVTLANDAGPSVTISDTGQTIATNESAMVVLVNTGAGALAAHIIGA